MLNWLLPSAFWILAAIVPVVILYFLRIRFRKQPVSSNYIWNRIRKENQSSSRLRFRSILLLLLQIMIVLMLAASAARPVWNRLTTEQPGMAFILDISASMSARDIPSDNNSTKSRWERAYEILTEEIRMLPQGTEIALFACSAGIEKIGKETGNYAGILEKLKDYRPNGAGFRESIVVSSLKAWLRTQNKAWRACLISDGGLDLNGQEISSLFNGNFKAIPVGFSGENLGITGLRFLTGGKAQFMLLNAYNTRKDASVILEKDDQILSKSGLTAEPGWSVQSLSIRDEIVPGVYTIRLETDDSYRPDRKYPSDKYPIDNYPVDDRYYLVIHPTVVKVLLAGEDNPFLKAGLKYPGIELSSVKDFQSIEPGSGNWDLTIADSIPVPAGWKGNLLCFNTIPPGSPVSPDIPVEGMIRGVNPSHTLMRFADIGDWYISKGNSLKPDGGAIVLAQIDDKPVFAAWEKEGNHYAVLSADLRNSNIGLTPGFPVVLQNYIKWCVPQKGNEMAYTLTAGAASLIKADDAWEIDKTNIASTGKADWYGRIDRNGPLLTLQGLSPGIFKWKEDSNTGFIAVNIPAGEMDLLPRNMAGTQQINMEPGIINQQEPISRWPLTILLIFLITEWFVWRGVKIPGFRSVGFRSVGLKSVGLKSEMPGG